MPVRHGQRLGHYEITGLLGQGGMGQVWRAHHVALGRDDALKVLPDTFAADPERLSRFQREAQVLASLNHSNIAQVYGLQDVDGTPAIVMELVEGPTLADRIAQGPLALDEALAIARQITLALEAAHEHGVIHRDLKPSNIKLRPDGTVKVLDFGLAKVFESEGRLPSASSMSPTITSPALPTGVGVILGTAAYASPEQARGKAVDKRADIWAFGVVLCEMVTGRRLFQGEDLTETIAAVVKSEPDLSGVPPQLRRLLRKCLEKDPRKRLRDIGDAWELLDAEPAAVAAVPTRRQPLLPWVFAGVLLTALGALAFVHFRETAPAPQTVEFLLDPPSETAFGNIYGAYAPSPDGRHVVISARRGGAPPSLWLRSLDSMTARPLPGTETANTPMWSPDSRSLAFTVAAEGKLKRIDIAGGAPFTLADVPAPGEVLPAGSWNRDGVILFGSTAGLQRVPATGGGATLLTKINAAAKETGHGYPQFLPDGNRFLYFVASSDPNVQGVYASSLESPDTREQILRTSTKAVYVPAHAPYPAYLLWMQEQTLVAQRFDADTLARQGDPVPVAEEIGLNPNFPSRSAFWASEAGSLLYFAAPPDLKRQLMWMSRDGRQLEGSIADDAYAAPALSRDARWLAVERNVSSGTTQANRDIWVWEFARETMTRLTFDSSREAAPVWSPDGAHLAFSSSRDGVAQIYRKNSSGTGTEERLTDGPLGKMPLDWSRDGRFLLYRQRHAGDANWDLMVLPLENGRKPIAVVATAFNDNVARFSPDGRWIAYQADDTGRPEIYLRRFQANGGEGQSGGRWQVSNTGGSDMKWRDDGRELYYETPDGRIMAAGIQTGPDGVRVETPRALFSADLAAEQLHSFDATPDGERFLLMLNPRDQDRVVRLTVITGWQAKLR
jgi:Tol biopolymer transport system component